MKAQDFLTDRAGHHIRYLFKSNLAMLEDLKKIHEVEFKKLRKSLPHKQDLIEQADYFTEEYYQIYRKKVLDIGNSVLRDYYSELDTLTVEFKFKK